MKGCKIVLWLCGFILAMNSVMAVTDGEALAKAVYENNFVVVKDLIENKKVEVNQFVLIEKEKRPPSPIWGETPRAPLAYLVDGIVDGNYKQSDDCSKMLGIFFENNATVRHLIEMKVRTTEETKKLVLSDAMLAVKNNVTDSKKIKILEDVRKLIDETEVLKKLFIRKDENRLLLKDVNNSNWERFQLSIDTTLMANEKTNKGNSELPEAFIKRNMTRLKLYYNERTLLHEAAYQLNLFVIQKLFEFGAYADAADKNGETPLFSLVDGIVAAKAINEKNVIEVIRLLAKHSNWLSQKNNAGETAMQKANRLSIGVANNEPVRKGLLIFTAICTGKIIDAQELSRAVFMNDFNAIQNLVEKKKVSVNTFNQKERAPLGYLVDGIISGNYKKFDDCMRVLEFFLKNKTHIEAIAPIGTRNRNVITEIEIKSSDLLGDYLDIAIKAKKDTLGFLAKLKTIVDECEALLSLYSELDVAVGSVRDDGFWESFKDKLFSTYLFYKHQKKVTAIISSGNSPKLRDAFIRQEINKIKTFYDGKTLLHEAAYRLNPFMVEKLLDMKADANALDYNGETPWFYILRGIADKNERYEGDLQKTMCLLYKKTKKNIKNKADKTINKMAEEFFAKATDKTVKDNINSFAVPDKTCVVR